MTQTNVPPVSILLAGYNGGQYIVSQLDSVCAQTGVDIKILFRDDGSDDNTLALVEQYKQIHSSVAIEVHQNKTSDKGHCRNFAALTEIALESQSAYFCYCDQDDVWHENKTCRLLETMRKLEAIHGEDFPILVHCDLRVVDDSLTEIAPSYVHYQGLPDPAKHSFPTFLYQNVVTGCTCLVNRALLKIASPFPEQALVHDWWLALCAQYYGVIGYIDEPLVDYRQHQNNAIGANRQKSGWYGQLYHLLIGFPALLSESVRQAQSLRQRLDGTGLSCNSSYFNYICLFADLPRCSLAKRLLAVNHIFGGNRRWLEKIYLSLVLCFIQDSQK